MQFGLLQAPVDAEAVLLPLHAPLALAAMQRAGHEGGDGVLTVVPRPGAQLDAPATRHALAQSAQARAARLVARARVSRVQAVPSPRTQPTRDTCGQVERGEVLSWM